MDELVYALYEDPNVTPEGKTQIVAYIGKEYALEFVVLVEIKALQALGLLNKTNKTNKATEGTVELSKRDELLNTVGNQKLRNAIDQMYRPGAKIGDGGLADVIRHELKTGELLSPKGHFQKGFERISNLKNIINKENLSPSDLKLAQDLLDDLQKALEGVKP
ncbi:hypothetical protein [Chengkuizengella sediminis]|uniref:hypothetical protein n=1 Tax=Chengkuizengella sediminis TaxID=1885917 RepID=UPI001389F1C8|nr:hypothetical protein [Chengkuizengella sediminis]NDI36669.1 hypothetical protein [Chengkuizengella sediminis]